MGWFPSRNIRPILTGDLGPSVTLPKSQLCCIQPAGWPLTPTGHLTVTENWSFPFAFSSMQADGTMPGNNPFQQNSSKCFCWLPRREGCLSGVKQACFLAPGSLSFTPSVLSLLRLSLSWTALSLGRGSNLWVLLETTRVWFPECCLSPAQYLQHHVI